MLARPSAKYQHYTPLHMPDREWPNRVLSKHPIWLSTDLRDGNQAIDKPMSIPQKLAVFRELVARGFREIEVGYPAASETEFGFIRTLIETNEVPDDVWLQVLMPAREDLIRRTLEAVRGAKQVIIHLYSSTAPLFRDIVYRMTKDNIVALAIEHTRLARQIADEYRSRYGTNFRLMYGIEGFSQSELDFVIKFCTEVKYTWESEGQHPTLPITFNVAATVESGPANHFADQIEYFSKNLPEREQIVLSIHVHNDRGTAIAATEQALLAGAERVEGCLFGNGERTGNVDLMILAMNLYTQGIDPGLDMSNMNDLVSLMTQCTGIPVHPRHPYAGSLVYTAFSGSHQDGIRKGLHLMEKRTRGSYAGESIWTVPYMPLDPTDIGRLYEVRVNSQSGKSGAAHIVEQYLDLNIPRPMQVQFSRVVQSICNTKGEEMDAAEICQTFSDHFYFHGELNGKHPLLPSDETIVLESVHTNSGTAKAEMIEASITIRETTGIRFQARVSDAKQSLVSLLSDNLGLDIVLSEEEHHASFLGLVEYVRLEVYGKEKERDCWGVGRAKDPGEAILRSIISAANSLFQSDPRQAEK